MVRGVALTLLVLSYPALGETLSYKEYQQRLGAGQERLDYSKQLIGHDQIHTLVPETRTGNQPEARPENAPSPTVGDGVETQSGSQGEQASQTQTRPGGHKSANAAIKSKPLVPEGINQSAGFFPFFAHQCPKTISAKICCTGQAG